MSIRNELLEDILSATGGGFDPETGISIERLYDGESAISTQEPSALDTAQYIQFGVVQGTVLDPIQTIAQGGDTEASILRINTAGTYRIKTAIQYGRTGASGTSILNFRVTINGVQAGRSINQRLENANQTTLFTDEAWITVPAGIDIVYEVIRDSTGSNSGGLIAGVTSGSTGWNASPSCAVRVERWIKTP
jgi:hypothetical protein